MMWPVRVVLLSQADTADEGPAPFIPNAESMKEEELSESGQIQADAIGWRLRWYDCGFTSVITGSQLAARQTARRVMQIIEPELNSILTMEHRLDFITKYVDCRTLITELTAKIEGGLLIVAPLQIVQIISVALCGQSFDTVSAEALCIDNGVAKWRCSYRDDAPRVLRSGNS
jgi:phosphohistidine phosphatase SixA